MSASTSKLIEFMMVVGRLKALQRTGWVRRNVREPETVASHMYRMAVMSMLADTQTMQGLNKDRCMKLCLVHDMAESIVGDITPMDGISKEEKNLREKEAMDKITDLVSDDVKQELLSLWQEYECGSTFEAKFVKDLDKFDMILQAYQYEKSDQKPHFLQEFFDSTRGKFQTGQVQGWMEELHRLREESQQNVQDTSQDKTCQNKQTNDGPS